MTLRPLTCMDRSREVFSVKQAEGMGKLGELNALAVEREDAIFFGAGRGLSS